MLCEEAPEIVDGQPILKHLVVHDGKKSDGRNDFLLLLPQSLFDVIGDTFPHDIPVLYELQDKVLVNPCFAAGKVDVGDVDSVSEFEAGTDWG